jgi:hypothetical protein
LRLGVGLEFCRGLDLLFFFLLIGRAK